jgi:hypothetical protein
MVDPALTQRSRFGARRPRPGRLRDICSAPPEVHASHFGGSGLADMHARAASSRMDLILGIGDDDHLYARTARIRPADAGPVTAGI